MKMVPLGEVAAINPRAPRLPHGEVVSFVGMAQLDAGTASATTLEPRPFGEVSKGYTSFNNGDLLIAKITPCWENGKVGQAQLDHPHGVGSTEFHVLRPQDDLEVRYALHFLRQQHIRASGTLRMTGSGGQRRVPASYISQLRIPLPSLTEQRRIATILDQADALRAKRREQLALLDALPQAIFHEAFGRPNHGLCLGDLVRLSSGGTPPKGVAQNWNGNVPWFSPKDIKATELFDSADHISHPAAERLTVHPENSVSVVTRGMILAHSVPVAILRPASTINQDLKILTPIADVDPEFLAGCVAAQEEWLLGRVETSAHGTKRLESSTLLEMPVPQTTVDNLAAYGRALATFRRLRGEHRSMSRATDELFASLQSRAFRGEL